MHMARAGGLSLVQLRYGARVEVDPGRFGDFFLITSALRGGGRARQGNRETSWTPGHTLVLSADLPTRLEFDAPFTQLTLRVERARIESLCGRLMGQPLDTPLRFQRMAFDGPMERHWHSTVGYLTREINLAGPLILHPRLAQEFEDYLLTSLLLFQPNNYSAELHGKPTLPPPRSVRRAEEFIEANAAEPVSVADIAAHAGVSARSLFSAFRQHRDATPMARLREVRLQNARNDLLEPTHRLETVSSIAMKWGFGHLGRFSAAYFEKFHEYPRETLRRGWAARKSQ